MDILVMAGQLLLGLTILVGVHEAGHMLSAKWFGMRVEKFSIGFPPKIFGKQIGETEYMVGAIPLGGFVKITGMVDESLDTEALSAEPQPYEFRAKPAWQRLIVMLGGIIVNVVTGILIFTVLIYIYGIEYIPAKEAQRYGVVPSPLGEKMGFREGDKIVKVNGRPFDDFNYVYDQDVLLGTNSYYTVERAKADGTELVDVRVPENIVENQDEVHFVVPRQPFRVEQVAAGSAAARAGLQAGDEIIRVGNRDITYFHELKEALADNAPKVEKPSLLQRFKNWLSNTPPPAAPDKLTPLLVRRNGQTLPLNVRIDADGTIGFAPKFNLNYGTHYYSLLGSVPKGAERAFSIVTGQAKAFAKIFAGKVSFQKSVGGPWEIAQQYGGAKEFSWYKFWSLTGMLSMVLAFMNLLPIPALDGGHVMFLTYEMVTGRKPSDTFLENAQKVGMVLLLSLMAFVIIINPIIKLLSN
ncbi:RIP metalloprotease [Hymenobacter gummosus]|uniref:RIP metalloprotease n=1 Tax=Hymenobacter gummosus TaxID=1776032 RepID=A0A3S0K5W7_9BACT|nr:M50 family metallopeptidase [Hymenobacter gummosus]RTQ50136.1 RIP metalloprotease [Hymenobacter gummosus]